MTSGDETTFADVPIPPVAGAVDFVDTEASRGIGVHFAARAYAALERHTKESLDTEICGVLVGHTVDGTGGPVVTIADIIRAADADEGKIHVTFTQDTWNAIHDDLRRLGPSYRIVGWYHTHPGFGVEFSDMDRFIQANFFPDPSQVAVLCDPLEGDIAIAGNMAGAIVPIDRFRVGTEDRQCTRDVRRRSRSREQIDHEIASTLARLDAMLGTASPARDDPALRMPPIEDVDLAGEPADGLFPHAPEWLADDGRGSASPERTLAASLVRTPAAHFARAELRTGAGLDATGQLRRLLVLCRLAVEAECAHRWERADFFVRESHLALAPHLASDELWDQVLADVEVEAHVRLAGTPAELRRRVIEEVVAEVPRALYHRRIRQGGPLRRGDRAFAHHDHLLALAALVRDRRPPWNAWLVPPARARVAVEVERGRLLDAERVCRRTLALTDDDALRECVPALYFAQATGARWWTRGRRARRRALERTGACIERLIAERRQLAGASTFHRALARLHGMRAGILRRNGGATDAALREAQKASAYLDVIAQTAAADSVADATTQAGATARARASETTLPDEVRRRLPFPVVFWLRSRQDRRLKTLSATAAVLALGAFVFGAVQMHARHRRDAAYAAVVEAAARNDLVTALAAAEKFIANRPVVGEDARADDVEQIYRASFVRWFVTQDEPLSDEARAQVARYASLEQRRQSPGMEREEVVP